MSRVRAVMEQETTPELMKQAAGERLGGSAL